MLVEGTVVSVEKDIQIEKNNGGTYPGSRISYRDKEGQLREQAWHENALKYNKAVANCLNELSTGDIFTMEKSKNDGGFWQVDKMYKGSTQKQHKEAVVQNSNSSGNWPTREERAQTQVHIIRQNCVTNAVNLLNVKGDKKVDTSDVIAIAKVFERYVHGIDDSEPTVD